jgi:uncharacterized lipoprotein YmbA
MTLEFRLIAAFVLVASMLAGCATSPAPRFYMLGTPAQPAAKAVYSVVVGALTVPDIVDRPQFVLRTAANEVTIPDDVRWAEPLKTAIPRVIAANVALALGDAYVSAYPQATGIESDYDVLVDIQRFESVLGEAATVEAQWTVRGVKDKSGALRSGRSVAREPVTSNDYDALVAAHGRALASISRDIAEAVRAARAAQ